MDSSKIKYPIYIVSKGRWEKPYTANSFLKESIDFKMVIEPQEYENYIKTIPKKNILVTDFSNLGLGSYPARNYAWEHSIKNGHKKHFVFDDNIMGFVKFNNGKKVKNNAVEPIVFLQTISDQYLNLAISGFNYRYFAARDLKKAMFINTHVYSAMLIRNDIPFRWRLKYNEDIDLCLQVLTNKLCTINLNYYLINKISTSAKLKGGNQTDLYKGNAKEKKILKAKSLEAIWPEYVKTVTRFNRPHHQISWGKHFKHPLLKKINKA